MEGDHGKHRDQKHHIGQGEVNDQMVGREGLAEQTKQAFRPAGPVRCGKSPHHSTGGRDPFQPMNIGNNPQAQQLG